MAEHEQLLEILEDADFNDDIVELARTALRLEKAYYNGEDIKPFMFQLRKSLEGIWGHDLPTPS